MTGTEEKLKDVKEWKDVAAKTWAVSVAGAVIIGGYGWLTNDMSMIGLAFSYFMLFSIAMIGLFSHWDAEQQELEEEKRVEKLEKRIEKLEEEVEYENENILYR